MAPGAKFNFWKSVGEVSLAKGYKLGGAIINGHSVEGKTIGGGICSTSTTLFNAALRAGFDMGAREPITTTTSPAIRRASTRRSGRTAAPSRT